MNARLLVLAVACLAMSGRATALADGGIRLTAKVGDVRKFKLTAVVKFEGQDLSVSGGVDQKIVAVDDAGRITVQVTAVNTIAKAGAQAVPVQNSPALIEVFRPDGTLSELRGENASTTSYRLETLTSVKLPPFPLAKDKTWTWDITPNAKVGIPRSSVTYKVLGDETIGGIDTWKLSRSIKELEGDSPATAEGTVWISKADGSRIKQVDVWKNAPVPNAPSEVDGTFTLEYDPAPAAPPASAHL